MNYKSIYTSPRFDDEDEEKKQKMPDPFSDRFLKTRQIVLTGEVNKELADSIAKQLLILDAEDSKKPIYMYIDSPGGDVDAGFAIYDVIRFIKAPVYLIGMGLIASAATLILIAVPKERRIGQFQKSAVLVFQTAAILFTSRLDRCVVLQLILRFTQRIWKKSVLN